MTEILERINEGLSVAEETLKGFTPGQGEVRFKEGDDPLTLADEAVDKALREHLPREGEGWLSEETVDSPERLKCSNVWIVDPIDGTREFVQAIPEWCVSIGYAVDGKAIAGGILNPLANQRIIGQVGEGVWLNGEPIGPTGRKELAGAKVLASRSEIKRGEWDRFEPLSFDIVPTGSVAYKLAMVATGMADATWTLVPKNEWDIAAGVALMTAVGGLVVRKDGDPVTFNQSSVTLLPGLIATGSSLESQVRELLL